MAMAEGQRRLLHWDHQSHLGVRYVREESLTLFVVENDTGIGIHDSGTPYEIDLA